MKYRYLLVDFFRFLSAPNTNRSSQSYRDPRHMQCLIDLVWLKRRTDRYLLVDFLSRFLSAPNT